MSNVKRSIICRILIVVVAAMVATFLVLGKWIVVYLAINWPVNRLAETLFPSPPKQEPSNEYYCDVLLSLQETSVTVTVSDVFDFDFDEAYVVSGPYGDEAFYLEELDVETAVPIFQWDTGGHYRIFFIKDKCIIYDFVYDIRQVDTLEKGMMIYPGTTMHLTEEFYGDSASRVLITFG